MKWTAAGKKIGDKVAYMPYRHHSTIHTDYITGETPTRWKIGGHYQVQKSTGRFVGDGIGNAYDFDEEVIAAIAEQERVEIVNDRFHQIRRWVEEMKRFQDDKQTVVDLLWPIVGPLIEGEKA